MQIITLLAGDTYFITLDGSLHLDLGIFDQFDQLLGHFLVDPLLELDGQVEALAGVNGITHVHRAVFDIALEQGATQDFNHLLELEIGIRLKLDLFLVQLEAGFYPTKIETGGQFTIGVVDGVQHLVHFDFRDNIE